MGHAAAAASGIGQVCVSPADFAAAVVDSAVGSPGTVGSAAAVAAGSAGGRGLSGKGRGLSGRGRGLSGCGLSDG